MVFWYFHIASKFETTEIIPISIALHIHHSLYVSRPKQSFTLFMISRWGCNLHANVNWCSVSVIELSPNSRDLTVSGQNSGNTLQKKKKAKEEEGEQKEKGE